MQVVVASTDVGRLRLALLLRLQTSILECVPMPNDRFVQLKIQFPVGQSAGAIQSIVSCTDRGVLVASTKPEKLNPCFHPVVGL
jgi:hypothetical protein